MISSQQITELNLVIFILIFFVKVFSEMVNDYRIDFVRDLNDTPLE